MSNSLLITSFPFHKGQLIYAEAWNCMSHLQTEGPRKARKEKDDMISSTLTREAIMSFFFPFRAITAGLRRFIAMMKVS